jgi:hypothetical protein
MLKCRIAILSVSKYNILNCYVTTSEYSKLNKRSIKNEGQVRLTECSYLFGVMRLCDAFYGQVKMYVKN